MCIYIYIYIYIYIFFFFLNAASLVAQLVKNPPPEAGMAIHSSILAWRILGIEEPDALQSMRSQKGQTHLSS